MKYREIQIIDTIFLENKNVSIMIYLFYLFFFADNGWGSVGGKRVKFIIDKWEPDSKNSIDWIFSDRDKKWNDLSGECKLLSCIMLKLQNLVEQNYGPRLLFKDFKHLIKPSYYEPKLSMEAVFYELFLLIL